MGSRTEELHEKGLIEIPLFFHNNIQYETFVGSMAYGVSSDTSDMDIYGIVIPPKNYIFPHLDGEIQGFGSQHKRFDQWQKQHINDIDALGGKGRNYDITIFNIIKFFQLCMENNPNMLDTLFTPITCVLHTTNIGVIIRDNRKLFLHKGSWHRFRGYAYAQLTKMKVKTRLKPERQESIDKYGFDTKFAYHIVRLINEVEQILEHGDIDLQRDNEMLKAIRNGDWTEERVVEYFQQKEKQLEYLYTTSSLQHSPDEHKIKQLLLDCLEEHYGSMDKCVILPDKYKSAITDIKKIIDKTQI